MKNLLCVVREHHLRQMNRTLAERIRIAVIYSLSIATVAAVAWAGGSLLAAHTRSSTQQNVDRGILSQVNHLMERHDCWGREAPPDMRGQIPGGVVLSYGDKAPVYTESVVEVGKALDHAFHQDYPSMTIYGFCRGASNQQ